MVEFQELEIQDQIQFVPRNVVLPFTFHQNFLTNLLMMCFHIFSLAVRLDVIVSHL